MKRRWIATSCDSCGRNGLHVLAPENSDGSIGASEFPSICTRCFDDPKRREYVEGRAAEEDAGSPT
jgi:hypothetical protein